MGNKMNLNESKGKVAVYGDGHYPWKLVDFPDFETFGDLYKGYVRPDSLAQKYQILTERAQGKSLTEVGKIHGISKERIRQIEAKFLRLFRQHHLKKQPS
jgi:hypothetical protein